MGTKADPRTHKRQGPAGSASETLDDEEDDDDNEVGGSRYESNLLLQVV